MKTDIEKYLDKYPGLNDNQVQQSIKENGLNIIEEEKKESILMKILEVFKEPMFLLLLLAASVYFIVGEYMDGVLMLMFVMVISAIEYIQETKTEKALDELKKLSEINVKVIRDKKVEVISSNLLVKGDIVILEEGDSVPADGKVLYSQSLAVNESLLTGESAVVYKTKKEDTDNHFKTNICYSGTNITGGFGIIEVTQIGKNTEIGKIGKSLEKITKNKSLLEKETNKLVYVCTIICAVVFVFTVLMSFINYSDLSFSNRIVESVLAGITIAMATIPEEIPVILTVFLAMGAWELSKEKTLTKNMKSIETLGTVSVLCTDKTGTLTQNKMEVKEYICSNKASKKAAYYSCPHLAYDPMEIAIKEYFQNDAFKENPIIKEYAFNDKIKMMGLLREDNTLYVKGAYESVLPLCDLDDHSKNKIEEEIKNYSYEGYRILVVASAKVGEIVPRTINGQKLTYEGYILLNDPPRKGVKKSIKKCLEAGIRVIMITGDSPQTAEGIARTIGIENSDEVLTGAMIEKMSDDKLKEMVKSVNIYARVYPNHKMRIVTALQENGEVVAMTGDGVNDATALKKADIGVSMGQRGTNVAKESSDVILLDDNFNTIEKAVENGRCIYKNIKAAISYILVIHIPVALLSLFVALFKLPPFLRPIHIVLLELLIDPTSSIIFQKIKYSESIMKEKPRKANESILDKKNIIKCLMQGLFIFLVIFINYYFMIRFGIETTKAITITYSSLLLSIMMVAFELRDDNFTLKALINSLKDKVVLFVNSIILILLLLIIYVPFLNDIAKTGAIGIKEWIYVILLVFIAVLPFDLLKIKKS